VDQQQLGLPSRDYFFNGSRELRAYHIYMTELSVLFNSSFDFALQEFHEVLAFETALANVIMSLNINILYDMSKKICFMYFCLQVSISEADRQDTSAIYRKDSLASLQMEVPEFNWTQYFQTFVHTELNPNEPIVSYAFPYLKDMAVLVKQTPPRVVRTQKFKIGGF
jgi:predicted metalloendopeptidase